MAVADLLRLYSAGVSLLLVIACVYSLYAAPTFDQRLRFGTFGLFGFVITSGQIDNLGQPGTWRLPFVAIAVTSALVGTGIFVRGDVRDRYGR